MKWYYHPESDCFFIGSNNLEENNPDGHVSELFEIKEFTFEELQNHMINQCGWRATTVFFKKDEILNKLKKYKDMNNTPALTHNTLKFLKIEVQNFKNITAKELEINGQSFIVLGKNASGKSSLIQALASPLDSKIIPSQAIKDGEERAKIEVTIGGNIGGEEKKYILELYFTPGKQSGRLVVTNEKGEAVKSPSTFVKSLIGNVSFDVMEFLHASKEKKIEMLKKLTGCGVEIDLINVEIKDKKIEKKLKKENYESLEGSVDNHGYTPAQVELFSTKVDIKPMQDQMAGMSKAVENYTIMQQKKKEFSEAIPKAESEMATSLKEKERLKIEIERLQGLLSIEIDKFTQSALSIEKNKANVIKCDEWFASHSKPDVEGINAKITAATEHNGHHDKLIKYGEQQRNINKLKEEVMDIDGQVKALEEKRNLIISKSQLPVKGLSFTESDIFIDNLPMEEGQLNSARLIDIGVDIAIAQNPNLKVIFIHDGSLFDKEGLKNIITKIEKHGYQAIIELVAENESVDIKFTETDIN